MEDRDAAKCCPTTTAVPHHHCFSHSAEGPIDVNMSEITMEDIHQFFSKDPSIKLGGHWKPSDCLPRWKVTGSRAALCPAQHRGRGVPGGQQEGLMGASLVCFILRAMT